LSKKYGVGNATVPSFPYPKTGLIVDEYGTKHWSLNGKYHRVDGPAFENANGNKVWYLNGKYHREDGPAIEYANGTKSWYLNGEPLNCKTQEEFEQLMRLKSFL